MSFCFSRFIRENLTRSISHHNISPIFFFSHAGNNLGNSIILANHCAWFVVDKLATKAGSSTSHTKASAGAGAAKDAANSVVGLLSSETVRMDIEDTQLRVGIKMIRNGV